MGVGKGTKHLGRFLECTKSYECVVLFGAATDSYDAVGKVVGKAGYEHVTRELVESQLEQFRGKIAQKPSIFSALKVDGKKMYEYAREGKDVPEVAARPVQVHELELVEWLEPGSHEFKWPEEEVDGEQMEGAEKLLGIREEDLTHHEKILKNRNRKKRTWKPEDDDHVVGAGKQPKRPRTESEPAMSGALPVQDAKIGKEEGLEEVEEQDEEQLGNSEKQDEHQQVEEHTEQTEKQVEKQDEENGEKEVDERMEDNPETQDEQQEADNSENKANDPKDPPPPETTNSNTATASPQPSPPAARIRMTVSSGFYVRSLCHDLGISCSSLGLMASLIRLRQGDYTLNENVLEYSDLSSPEIWEPKVAAYLEEYMWKEGWTVEEVDGDGDGGDWKKEGRRERREGDRERSYKGGGSGGWGRKGGNGGGKRYYDKKMNGGGGGWGKDRDRRD